jgi:hypothetical protein
MTEEEQGRLIDVIIIRRRIITIKEEYIAEIPIQGLSCEGCTDLLLACEINIITRIDKVVYSLAHYRLGKRYINRTTESLENLYIFHRTSLFCT